MSGPAELVRRVSPAHRRWRRLLDSCSMTPDAGGFADLGSRDFLICGHPRSGTALLAAQLFQPPQVVTVMEPWDGLRLEPADLLDSLRREMEAGLLTRGRLDLHALSSQGEVRWVRDGEAPSPVGVTPETQIGVKWPGFWRLLPHLPNTRFIVCLRHPAEVIASFRETGGRLARGLEYDVALHEDMNRALLRAHRDDAIRRVALYDQIAEGLIPHLNRGNVFIVRYERWSTEPARLMEELSRFLDADLKVPGPAAIRAPDTPSSDDIRFVAKHCRTVSRLGYVRDQVPGR